MSTRSPTTIKRLWSSDTRDECPVWAFFASRTARVTPVTTALLDLSGPVYNNVPADHPLWSPYARSCQHRPDAAVELRPPTIGAVGGRRSGVDRAVPEQGVQLRAAGHHVLEPGRQRDSLVPAGGRVRVRVVGHDGLALHDSLPPRPFGDA